MCSFKIRRQLKHALFALASFWLVVLPVGAQFNAAMDAYDRQDYRRAVELFAVMAEQGDIDAQYFLGRLTAAGKGTLQDYVEAHKWFNIASSEGHRHAAEARDNLAKRMESRQISRAQRLARQWLEDDSAVAEVAVPSKPPGLDAKRISVVQSALNDLGYDAGSADGVLGKRTEIAIRQFQADQGLNADGVLDEALLEKMKTVWSARQRRSERSHWAEQRWPRLVLRDTFRDGNFTENPRWRVSAGRFEVRRGVGLRSSLIRNRPKSPANGNLKSHRLEALREYIERSGQQSEQSNPDYAQIHTARRFDNSFQIELDFSAPQSDDTVSFGPFVNNARGLGYRLVFNAETAPEMALVRMTTDGYRVLQTGDRVLKLTDGRSRKITWTRNASGLMTVRVNGEEIMRISDRVLRSDFAGFTLVNQGGVYDMHAVEIYSRR